VIRKWFSGRYGRWAHTPTHGASVITGIAARRTQQLTGRARPWEWPRLRSSAQAHVAVSAHSGQWLTF